MSNGTGPGVITPDGCAVDLYAELPPGRDPQIVHAAVPAGASVLELGCGAGRMTGPLVALGHPVVAVDESPEMLAHVRGAQTVRARIEELRLDRRFDVVLLASHLVNTEDDATRRAFLATCRWHLAPGGCAVIQQWPPDLFGTLAASERTEAGITFRWRDVSRPGPGRLSATVEYVAGDRVWTQSFTAVELTGERLREVLGEAGLEFAGYLTEDHAWVRAVAASAPERPPGGGGS